ncbi:MAG: hypothetical protein LR015_00820 [Verrucomicrobia bacterium]|nr:hypothetical protein [Verrucomicrobiota bacterium]
MAIAESLSPCCSFAIGAALWMMADNTPAPGLFANTALIASGEAGVAQWREMRDLGYTRAKWKIAFKILMPT